MSEPSTRQQALLSWLDGQCTRASLPMAERLDEALVEWYGQDGLDMLLLKYGLHNLVTVSFAPNYAYIKRVFNPLVRSGKARFIRPDAIVQRGELRRDELVLPTKSV